MKDLSQFKSTRYFQLIPDILVEYNYYDVVTAAEQIGDARDRIVDFGPSDYNDEHQGRIVSNKICNTRTFIYKETEHDEELNRGYREKNVVLPINNSESKFIQCIDDNSEIWTWNKIDFGCEAFSTSTGNNDLTDDIFCDTFRLHFTSRNYLGNNRYDGFIISVFLYDKYKNKIGLLSQYVRKTDDPTIHQDPVLINQKLYTTYMDFIVPNPVAIVKSKENYIANALPGEDVLRQKLFPKYDILDNSPMVMCIYGVKSTYTDNTHEYYNVEKLNTIYIPIIDKSNNLSIEIKEAEDGDYFDIYPTVDDEVISFSDYVYNISDGRPELYIVFHELTLTEYPVNEVNSIIEGEAEVTHREQFIINASQQKGGDEDDYPVNEGELDRHIYYRPVIRNASKNVAFLIDVKTYIINTLDNTTILRQSSLMYGSKDSDVDNANPNKYGKKMNKIYLGEIPAQINVYNKKPDLDRDGLKITNASSNVKIENHQHSIIGFIECANVGVAIEQVPIEQIQQQ